MNDGQYYDMRSFFLIALVLLLLAHAACRKNSCHIAVATQTGTPCGQWGIRVGSHTYPADSIPLMFQQEGMPVCVKYELYQDQRLCPCCGGIWARIKRISFPED